MERVWINFVGRSYWSPAQFRKEALKYGVSRRISLHILKKMKWGDLVLLLQKKGKHAVCIGAFRVTKIGGFSQEAVRAVEESGLDIEEVEWQGYGEVVKRKCGSYVVGAIYVVRAEISDVVEVIEGVENVGTPMVGGSFIPVEALEMRFGVSLRRLPFAFFRSFRRIDFRRLLHDLKEGKVFGQYYYSGDGGEEGGRQGYVEVVETYSKAKPKPRRRRRKKQKAQQLALFEEVAV